MELKKELEAALQHHRSIANTGTAPEKWEATCRVKELQDRLSAAIAEGAQPCCGESPRGMEQPGPRGGVEYEIGCRKCGRSVRGGLRPRHTVEIWNEK
jgi:hypothetical protein